jgi:hypothetical protein
MPKLEPQGSYLQYRLLGGGSGLCAHRDDRSYTYTYAICYCDAYTNSVTYSYSNAYSMLGKMFTDTEAVSNFGGETHSAPSFNTAAHAYRFAPSYSSAAAVEIEKSQSLAVDS